MIESNDFYSQYKIANILGIPFIHDHTGIKIHLWDLIELLQDELKYKEALKKLKLKAFW